MALNVKRGGTAANAVASSTKNTLYVTLTCDTARDDPTTSRPRRTNPSPSRNIAPPLSLACAPLSCAPPSFRAPGPAVAAGLAAGRATAAALKNPPPQSPLPARPRCSNKGSSPATAYALRSFVGAPEGLQSECGTAGTALAAFKKPVVIKAGKSLSFAIKNVVAPPVNVGNVI